MGFRMLGWSYGCCLLLSGVGIWVEWVWDLDEVEVGVEWEVCRERWDLMHFVMDR